MKERPILFSATMVRAILDGRKTQTRRIVKPQPSDDWHPDPVGMYAPLRVNRRGEEYPGKEVYGAADEDEGRMCPYGKPGDRLWVRETWQQVHPLQVKDERFSLAGRAGIPGPPPVEYRVIYRADGEYSSLHFGPQQHPYRTLCSGDDCTKDHIHPEERWHGWQPSIHMPRWASRITLEITDVRVQRVQEISEGDAKAEGASDGYPLSPHLTHRYRIAFRDLWDSINGKKNPWASNPWVWTITFRRIDLPA